MLGLVSAAAPTGGCACSAPGSKVVGRLSRRWAISFLVIFLQPSAPSV
ncbi:hypothetical protein [Nocardia abscessus]|nr:hypothetical protein [Nocardia abscessus]